MERAQLMGHRVAHTQERVGKCHTGHGGCVGHLLTSHRIVGAVVVGAGQVLEDHLQRADSQTVGIIGSHHGSVSLQAVGHCVNTGSSSQTLRRSHVEVCVHNRHIGHQLIVSQRVLHAGALIGNYSKGRCLGTGTG